MDDFYALIIGVGGGNIAETVKDATDVQNVLVDKTKGAYSPKNTFLLTEANSTKSKIISAIDKIIANSSVDSTIFIYYSGHGQRIPDATNNIYNYYLVTHGADISDKDNTMLSGKIFSDKIAQIKARRMVVMLDCCYAGGMGKLKMKDMNSTFLSNRVLVDKLSKGKGRVIISSCEDTETSVILQGSENSLFTEVALEVLKGLFSPNLEYVSALDLIYSVLKEVPKRIAPFNHSQTPILSGAQNLNHKYFICKNGEWKPPKPKPPKEKSIKPIQIDKEKESNIIDLSNLKDFKNEDMNQINDFFNNINLENKINDIDKLDFIVDVGGMEGFKKITNRVKKIKSQNKAELFKNIDSKNVLRDMNVIIDEQEKLEFINNYKNKI